MHNNTAKCIIINDNIQNHGMRNKYRFYFTLRVCIFRISIMRGNAFSNEYFLSPNHNDPSIMNNCLIFKYLCNLLDFYVSEHIKIKKLFDCGIL